MVEENLCKLIIESGGEIFPLNINSKDSKGMGICNPSIIKHNGDILLNLRNVFYNLYVTEDEKKFPSRNGPIIYMVDAGTNALITENYMCKMDDKYEIINSYKLTNTTKLDKKPKWTFIGLEDARLVSWEGKLYQTGVRRDTTPNGVGRIELSEINDSFEEISRVRINIPSGKTYLEGGSYCEKNWMPINDLPFHYIKWTNPTEILKVNPENGNSSVVKTVKQKPNIFKRDIRGSSNVIKYKNYWVALTHEVDLWRNYNNQKEAIYWHRFVVWDDKWEIKYFSKEFRFSSALIEFSCGLSFDNGELIIPFSIHDNTSFMLKCTTDTFEYIVGMNKSKPKVKNLLNNDIINNFMINPHNSKNNTLMGDYYYKLGHLASAMGFYLRATETSNEQNLEYNNYYMATKCVANLGKRDKDEFYMWRRLIEIDPSRYEGYVALCRYYDCRNEKLMCKITAQEGMRNYIPSKFEINISDITFFELEWYSKYYELYEGKKKNVIDFLYESKKRKNSIPDFWLKLINKKIKELEIK